MTSRLRICKFLLSGAIVAALLTVIYFNATTPFIRCASPAPEPNSKTVLYWTTIWGRDAVSLLGGKDVYRCSPTCIITTNRCLQSVADTVVFHHYDVSLLDIPDKAKHQKWIFMTSESPPNTITTASIFLRLMDSSIDAVMSYRSDSPIRIPYAKVIRKHTQTTRQPVPLKPKSVAWFVSNCDAPSGRQEFAAELSKYIPVDIYGACGPLSCPRANDSCNQMLEQTYSFYLALENSLCKDYVTEKLYRTMRYNIIPIVLGPKDNYSHLPRKSVIHADDFKSLPFLAMYLRRVASNESLYNSYLDWKTEYDVQLTNHNELCTACGELNNTQAKRPRSWSSWWFDDAHCYSWRKS